MNARDRIRRLSTIIIGIAASLTMRAETRDIQMRFLGIAEGLSHQTVNCFCQDEFGFVWIGTQDGLNRFDGRTVDRFKPDGSPYGINSNNIRQLYSDRNGHLFIRSLQCVERYDLRLERFDLLYNGDVSAMDCDGGKIYLVDNDRILRIDGTLPAGELPQPETIFSFSDLGEHPGSINNLIVAGNQLILSSSKLGLLCISQGGELCGGSSSAPSIRCTPTPRATSGSRRGMRVCAASIRYGASVGSGIATMTPPR